MLSFFNRDRRIIKSAKELVHMASKVIGYRKDVLKAQALDDIEAAKGKLQAAIKTKPLKRAEVEKAEEALDALLVAHGGKIYPMGFMAENVEMIVVAAILAIGFRTFFFQPFKIPTNSMYPSYYGMTETIYDNPDDLPGPLEKVFNWIMLGAENYTVLAPATGELVVPLAVGKQGRGGGALAYEVVPTPALFGLLKQPGRQYSFAINGKVAHLQVPLEYNLDDVFLERYFPKADSYKTVIDEAVKEGRVRPGKSGQYMWFTGITVKADMPILDFDILSGDRLFIDRVTYNFRSPQVGEAIVFHTRKIKGLAAPDGTPNDQYYIKRLVGLPGDTLELKGHGLYRNGSPITGAKAFGRNAEQEGLFPGYVAAWNLKEGVPFKVPATGYYAMGDNSPHSLDSRSWETVPTEEVIGRAVFIYYPFSKRWGVSD